MRAYSKDGKAAQDDERVLSMARKFTYWMTSKWLEAALVPGYLPKM